MDLPIVAPQGGAFSNTETAPREEHWGLCGVQPEGNDAAAWKAVGGTTGEPAGALGWALLAEGCFGARITKTASSLNEAELRLACSPHR